MSSERHDVEAYFHAIEETFIRLRGAPLLLSPADWKTAEAWHAAGIPLELVEGVLETVFERLRERDPERRIHSLRYCAPAVEEAWREVSDLTATAGRLEVEPVDVAARLEALARRLPADLPPALTDLGERLVALGGGAEEVERRLEAMDERLLEGVAETLEADLRQRLEERAARSVERASDRIEEGEADALGRRLFLEAVRRERRLPTLSLFSPDAEPPGAEDDRSAPRRDGEV